MATVFENALKKCPRVGPYYQMEISYPDDDMKKRFLSRLEQAKSSLNSTKTYLYYCMKNCRGSPDLLCVHKLNIIIHYQVCG